MGQQAHAIRDTGPTVAQFPHHSAINPVLDAFTEAVTAAGAHLLPHQLVPGNPAHFPAWVDQHLHHLDVIHLHWFQRLYLRRGRLRTLHGIRQFITTLRRAQRHGIAVTWTVHNLRPHEQPYPRLDALAHNLVGRLIDRATVETPAALPELYRVYPMLEGRTSTVALGSYQSIYPPPIDMSDARQRLGLPPTARIWLAFGLIRRYKQVPELITTFAAALAGPDNILLVAGEPHTDDERRRIEHAARTAPNVILQLHKVPDHAIPAVFGAANYVVCNYRATFNSGVILLAASYGRSVIAQPVGTSCALPNDMFAARIAPDPDGLHHALRLSAGANWHHAGATAFRWASSRTWTSTGTNTVATWDQAIRARRQRRAGPAPFLPHPASESATDR
ncbi:hypothetical protein AB0M46_00250 [Dactylosporangium sp. NPDC051485]|uniref:hypothetical protein n=1 Tax=Dactylosporangium sp. NPDC051485 TaxID=3154846 RepID=UPI003414BC4C